MTNNEQFIAVVKAFALTHGVKSTLEAVREGFEEIADPIPEAGESPIAYWVIAELDDLIMDIEDIFKNA